MVPEFEKLLVRLADIPYEAPFSFRKNTTVGVGGDAPLCLYPRSSTELVLTLRETEGIPRLLLGRGSNVLPSDRGFGGVVIKTDRARSMRMEGGVLYAECGVSVSAFLRFAAERGRGGLAFLAGIPASMGGVVFMNAGAGGRYIGELVESVRVYEEGEVRLLSTEDCRFAYKETRFMHQGSIVLEVAARTTADKYASEKICEALAARSRLPKERSMGCVFRNPPGAFAGALIEQAGLKGANIGGAQVSAKHANFIVNRGGATAEDFRALIAAVKEKVFSETGIKLVEEIRYIGEFYASDG